MTLAKAIAILIDEYQKAEKNDRVKDTAAYALYHAWRRVENAAKRAKVEADAEGD